MNSINRKFWLMTGALLCLAPAAFAAGSTPTPCSTCRAVPDGGSALVYVLGAGITCLGGMLVRFRARNGKS